MNVGIMKYKYINKMSIVMMKLMKLVY